MNLKFEKKGIKEMKNVKELTREELPVFLTNREFKAINVTIPYKQEVIPFLDFVSDEAKSINAVNTIVNKNGKLTYSIGKKLAIGNYTIKVKYYGNKYYKSFAKSKTFRMLE